MHPILFLLVEYLWRSRCRFLRCVSFFAIRRTSSRKYRVTIFRRFVLSSPWSSHPLRDGRRGKGEGKSSRFNRINYIHLTKYSRRDVSSTTIECLFPLKRLRRGEKTLQESPSWFKCVRGEDFGGAAHTCTCMRATRIAVVSYFQVTLWRERRFAREQCHS